MGSVEKERTNKEKQKNFALGLFEFSNDHSYDQSKVNQVATNSTIGWRKDNIVSLYLYENTSFYGQRSFLLCARKMFRKTNIFLPPDMHTACAYQGTRNISILENVLCALNGWPLTWITKKKLYFFNYYKKMFGKVFLILHPPFEVNILKIDEWQQREVTHLELI